MRWLSLFLFGYSTIMTVFLLVSGLISFENGGNPILLFLLLPTFGYFIYHIAHRIIDKVPIPTGANSMGVHGAILFIFVLLVSYSLYAIYTHTSTSTTGQQPELQLSPTLSPTPTPITQKQMGIIKTDDNSPVNLRQMPSIKSKSIDKIKSQTMVEILGQKNGWTQIRIPSLISGWIKSEFVSSEKQNPT